MDKWNRTVKLSQFWRHAEDVCDIDISGLRHAIETDTELNEWYECDATPLAEIETTEEFNGWLDDLYDFADERLIWIPPSPMVSGLD